MSNYTQNSFFNVTKTGDVAIDFNKRRNDIALMTQDEKLSLIADVDIDYASFATPILDVQSGKGQKPDRRTQDFGLMLMQNTSEYLVFDDLGAAAEAIDYLVEWAEADAFTVTYNEHANTYYSLRRFVLPVITSYAVLRHANLVSESEHQTLMNWMEDIVILQDKDNPTPSATTNHNNHRMFRGSVNAAWGALSGDGNYLTKGFQTYMTAINAMNDDGSFTLELKRKKKALYYQRHAVSSLTTIAQIAEVQGYDLYNYTTVEGKSLHRGIGFLTKAVYDPFVLFDGMWNNGVGHISHYAFDQDLTFLNKRGHDRHYMSFIEAYYDKQDPTEVPTGDFFAMYFDIKKDGAMLDDLMGGNATAFYWTFDRIV